MARALDLTLSLALAAPVCVVIAAVVGYALLPVVAVMLVVFGVR
jgi:hypothetical protein